MRARTTLLRAALAAVAILLPASAADAYPEFQKFAQARSGRTTNCAMCHAHPDGPDGAAFGQIGALSPDELARLNRARAAFEPGQEVDNPILNRFGNHIVSAVGKTRLLELRNSPEQLAAALGGESDLDGDGVPDAQEFLDGTHPLKRTDGNPWLLFTTNLARYRFHVVMIIVATAMTIYGLASLLRGTEVATSGVEEE